VGAENHPFEDGLRYQQPVKRIIVMPRQGPRALSMDAFNRQKLETKPLDRVYNRRVESQFRGRPLDRDFPHGRGADENLVAYVSQRRQ
jgi:hypothetical protein